MQTTKVLRRSRQDRVLSGVCAGLANHHGLKVKNVRIAFVLLTLFTGSGLLVYLLAWLLIPEETD